jgi:hypothetical protein
VREFAHAASEEVWKIVSAHTQYVTVHDIDTQRNIAKWYALQTLA